MKKAKTLYVHRPLINGEDLLRWARKHFKTTLALADLHVTIAYSKRPLLWPQAENNTIAISGANPPREVTPLGDKGAVVLKFDSMYLYRRWREILDEGASWDYASYQPHVTITYDGKGVDLSKVKPFTGELEFGPEVFAVLDEDWSPKEVKNGKAA